LAITGIPAIVSGCLSPLSWLVSALSIGLEWPRKAGHHESCTSRFGEVVRDINIECTFHHFRDADYTSEGSFIRHIWTEMNMLEENAPNIPGCMENLSQIQNEWRHRGTASP
jgi:hypothetical protein